MAYTPEFRAQVLVALEANGGNVSQTAEQFNISRPTIDGWVKENLHIKSDDGNDGYDGTPQVSDIAVATAEILPATREDFIADLKTVRNKVLKHLDGIVSDLKAREAAITLGILIDKTELLEGNATSRTAVVGNGESVDEAIRRLTGELESRVTRPEILEVASPDDGVSQSEPTAPGEQLE